MYILYRLCIYNIYIYIYVHVFGPLCLPGSNSLFIYRQVFTNKLRMHIALYIFPCFSMFSLQASDFLKPDRKVQQSLQIALEATGRCGERCETFVSTLLCYGAKDQTFGNKTEVDIKDKFTKEYIGRSFKKQFHSLPNLPFKKQPTNPSNHHEVRLGKRPPDDGVRYQRVVWMAQQQWGWQQ